MKSKQGLLTDGPSIVIITMRRWRRRRWKMRRRIRSKCRRIK